MDPSQDRLSPEVKRDVYFGDLEVTRREAVRNAAFTILFTALSVAMLFAGPQLRRPVMLGAGLIGATSAVRSIRDWRKLRVKADDDVDLMSDARLATEDRQASFMRGMGAAAQVSNIVMLFLLGGFIMQGLGLKF
jgi:hypothetical protein